LGLEPSQLLLVLLALHPGRCVFGMVLRHGVLPTPGASCAFSDDFGYDSFKHCQNLNRRAAPQSRGHGSAFQIPAAYSAMVRSLENFPEQATLRMALRAHASGSAYRSPARCCAPAYAFRSA